MADPEHWFCPGCGEIDGPRAGMICHGPGFTGGCASVRNEVVEISHDAAQRLAGAVDAEITDAELDAAWGAWHVAWVTTDGRTAMRSALAAFLAARGGR